MKIRKLITVPLFYSNVILLLILFIIVASKDSKKQAQQAPTTIAGTTTVIPAILPEFVGLPLDPPFKVTAEFEDPEYFRIIGMVHKGIDLTKHYGATVYSILDADVLQTEGSKPKQGFIGNRAGSNYVITRSKIGTLYYYTYYWHLDRPLVLPGTTVKKGTPIGIQGNSGYTSGTHLHLEIRVTDKPIAPDSSKAINPRLIVDFSKNR